MQTFTDALGKTRTFTLSIDTVIKIRSALDVDLLDVINADDIFDPEASLSKLSRDPVLLCQVLHIAIGGDFDEFAQSMHGDAIANATAAYLRELMFFFPPEARETIQHTFDQHGQVQKAILTRTRTEVDRMTADSLDRLRKPMRGTSSGNVPDVSSSTPDH